MSAFGHERAICDAPERERRQRRPAEALGDDVDLLMHGPGEAFEYVVVQERGIPRHVYGDVGDGLERVGRVDLAAGLDVHVADDVFGHGRELDQDAAGLQADLLLDAYLDSGVDVHGAQERGKDGGHVEVGGVLHPDTLELGISPDVAMHGAGRGAGLVGPVGDFAAMRPLVDLVVEGFGREGVVHAVRAGTHVVEFDCAVDLIRAHAVHGHDHETERSVDGAHTHGAPLIYRQTRVSQ